MDSFYQTGIIEMFRRGTGVGAWKGLLLVYKLMLFLRRLLPHHPPPPDLRRELRFRFARLVIDAQWRVGEGARAR